MNLLKIFFPNSIKDKPVYGFSTGSSSETKDTALSPNSISSTSIPTPTLASDVVGISLNTQARQILGGYTFGQVGALAVGKYINGVSGDIRISPSGIVGRNSSGTNTFTIDGVTGDATFLGTVTATAGLIGGFTIASGYLWAGATTNTCGLSPVDYPFWAGDTYANRATAPFRVTPGGAITVTDININVTSDGSIAGTPGATGAEVLYNNASRVLISGGGITLRNTRAIYMGETTTTNFAKFGMDSDNIAYFRTGPTTDELWIEDHDLAPYAKFQKIEHNSHTHSYLNLDTFLEVLHRTNAEEPGANDLEDGTIWYDSDDDEFHCMVNNARYKFNLTAL